MLKEEYEEEEYEEEEYEPIRISLSLLRNFVKYFERYEKEFRYSFSAEETKELDHMLWILQGKLPVKRDNARAKRAKNHDID